jgi:cysteine desulfurase
MMSNTHRIYLDNNATTFTTKEVSDMLYQMLINNWGNPSSIYAEGELARSSLRNARTIYANILGVEIDNVYFTSCGTESNNIALRSVMCAAMTKKRNVLITSNVEHPSVKITADHIGCKHVIVPVNKIGMVTPEALLKVLGRYGTRVGMISIIMAQNEFGTIQPIRELTTIVREFCNNNNVKYIPFHSDATQMFGKYIKVEPNILGIDMMTGSAHKYHGPRGVGILYARKNLIDPGYTIMTGGGQESGCRSGTENVPSIIASATALLQSIGNREEWFQNMKRTRHIRDIMAERLIRNIPGLIINGVVSNDALYNTLNVSIPGVFGYLMVEYMDSVGISISAGSACSKGRPSEAIIALHYDQAPQQAEIIAKNAIRISLNRYNTESECLNAADHIIRGWKTLSNKF